jgi:hypothetical protein
MGLSTTQYAVCVAALINNFGTISHEGLDYDNFNAVVIVPTEEAYDKFGEKYEAPDYEHAYIQLTCQVSPLGEDTWTQRTYIFFAENVGQEEYDELLMAKDPAYTGIPVFLHDLTPRVQSVENDECGEDPQTIHSLAFEPCNDLWEYKDTTVYTHSAAEEYKNVLGHRAFREKVEEAKENIEKAIDEAFPSFRGYISMEQSVLYFFLRQSYSYSNLVYSITANDLSDFASLEENAKLSDTVKVYIGAGSVHEKKKIQSWNVYFLTDL